MQYFKIRRDNGFSTTSQEEAVYYTPYDRSLGQPELIAEPLLAPLAAQQRLTAKIVLNGTYSVQSNPSESLMELN